LHNVTICVSALVKRYTVAFCCSHLVIFLPFFVISVLTVLKLVPRGRLIPFL